MKLFDCKIFLLYHDLGKPCINNSALTGMPTVTELDVNSKFHTKKSPSSISVWVCPLLADTWLKKYQVTSFHHQQDAGTIYIYLKECRTGLHYLFICLTPCFALLSISFIMNTCHFVKEKGALAIMLWVFLEVAFQRCTDGVPTSPPQRKRSDFKSLQYKRSLELFYTNVLCCWIT